VKAPDVSEGSTQQQLGSDSRGVTGRTVGA